MADALPDTPFLERINSIVGSAGWIDPTRADGYFVDARNRFRGDAQLVVRPSSTNQVSQVVALCNQCGVGLVPFGGGTGGSAGHIDFEQRKIIVLSLERMNAIRSVSQDNDTIDVEAGCVLVNVKEAARQHNRCFGLSLASEGSCTIGGNLSSNAGGVQVLRYGNARDMCLGVEVVLPDGAILKNTGALRKDNTGYDLRHLMIGSEGTLGIITAATLKLFPVPKEIATVMCAFPSPGAALALLGDLRNEVGEAVTAFELMSRFGMDLATRHFPELGDPFEQSHSWFGLVDVEGHIGIGARLEGVLERMFSSGIVTDAVLAQSGKQRQSLWNLRELAYEYNRQEGVIFSSDTSVPIAEVENFIAAVECALAGINPLLRVNCYGHVGDGNIHVNVFPPEGVARSRFLLVNPTIQNELDIAINETTASCGGSISAEHGIGRVKRDALLKFGDPVKQATMRAIKAAIDPNNIMNPGAVFAN